MNYKQWESITEASTDGRETSVACSISFKSRLVEGGKESGADLGSTPDLR